MAHCEFADLSRSVRAVWAEFGATVAGHSGSSFDILAIYWQGHLPDRQDDSFDASSERLDPP
eukprot:scaffold17512_cov52-Phaeocystis_antarctica.AAC.1